MEAIEEFKEVNERYQFLKVQIDDVEKTKEELLKQMMAISYKSDVSLVILMLTDVLLEGSYLLFVGDDDIISQAFDVSPKDNEVFLPEVMSRKKQVIPSLSALWG